MAVATVGVTVEDLRFATEELHARRHEKEALERELQQRDGELRIRQEEAKLMGELHQINQMTKRKLDSDVDRPNKMQISSESLSRIIALEDELKLIDKKKKDLEHEAQLLAGQHQRTDDTTTQITDEIIQIKDVTGWDRYNYASRGYVNAGNLFREHQKKLAKQEEEQQSLKKITEKLTAHIEELSQELEVRKQIDEATAEANHHKAQAEERLADIRDQIQQMKRISLRKEKMLDLKERSDVTDAKELRALEGDKRVLHSDLSKIKERERSAEKAILAQDVKLRRLEGQLNAVAAFLSTKFTPADEAEGETPADGEVDPRAPVPVKQFNQLHEQLTQTKVTLEARDQELEEMDATIEQLEKNHGILQAASNSRAAVIAQSRQEMNRDTNAINDRVDDIEEDYQREKQRLTLEQQRLAKQLARIKRENGTGH